MSNSDKFNSFTQTIAASSDGLRFAVKDNIPVRGFETSWGLKPAVRPSRSEEEPFITRLKEVGYVCVGKTNLDPLALSGFGINAFWGDVKNPRYPKLSSLGSSSGSAAAVAGELVDFAIGTDSAGSIRAPAAATGTCGLMLRAIKPSCRLMGGPLDSLGIFANSLKLLGDVLERVIPELTITLPRRLLIPALDGVIPEVRRHFEMHLAQLPYELLPTQINFQRLRTLTRILLAHEARSCLDVLDVRDEALPEECRPLLALANEPLPAAEINEQTEILRNLLRDSFILTPTLVDLPTEENARSKPLGLYLPFANLADLAALSFPLQKEPFPLAFQLVGLPGSERSLISVANQFGQ